MVEHSAAEELVSSNPEALRELALRRVKKRRDFHAHLFSYAVVNTLIWGIWAIVALTSGGWYPWPIWVTACWGIGLIFHVWDTYFRRPITEDEVAKEMEHLLHGT